MKRILVVGATSAIAEACARNFAEQGATLYLAGRDENKLSTIADDLRVRGAQKVEYGHFDALEPVKHQELVQRASAALGGFDVVLVSHGTLPDQLACQRSSDSARRELEINALGTISICGVVANMMENADRGGIIAVVTSVAGDRGRQSNYVYGAAKACVSTFLSGLRHRLHSSGVRVLDIRPGFVDTPMTSSLKKGALWATPAQVARDITSAIGKGRNGVMYTPWFWRWIMLLIRCVPAALFVRTRL